MAKSGSLPIGRYFFALVALFAVLYSIVFLSARSTPKLGLDLVGGVRVIYTAQTPKGAPAPTSAQMSQARQILEDRINGTGVTGSTVVVQGSNQLVVEIPNGTNNDVAELGAPAILNFRGVIAPAQVVDCVSATTGASGPNSSPGSSSSPSGGATAGGSASSTPSSLGALGSRTKSDSVESADSLSGHLLGKAPSGSSSSPAKSKGSSKATSSATAKPTGSSTSAGTSSSPSPTPTTATTPRCLADPFATLFKADPSLKSKMPNAETCPAPGLATSKCKAYASLSTTQQNEIAAALSRVDCSGTQVELDDPDSYYYACDDGTTFGTKANPVNVAYLLGYVVVPGKLISSATAEAPDATNISGWTVALTLSSSGGNRWNAWTSKYHTSDTSAAVVQTSATAPCGPSAATPCSDFVGFTLNGQVISAPVTQAVLDQNTQISGTFTSSTASDLARELNYGKLPVSFRADAIESVSATLGSRQLSAAFLAGGIGLALVVLYSLLYYRMLGFVTIASLLVSGGLTYAMLVILGKQLGYTLDLAGVAGFIVALGITADSFVVFFERLKDEVHEGRSARVAVPRAWVRARRTILSADTVSFMAAAILYYFASADVKGFAFTLGMSTVLDVVVVFLFTHPLVYWLSQFRSFGSARMTGLDAIRGGVVAGTGSSRAPAAKSSRAGAAAAASRAETSVDVLDSGDADTHDSAADGSATELATAQDAAAPPSDAGPTDGTASPSPRTATPSTAAERAALRRARARKKDES